MTTDPILIQILTNESTQIIFVLLLAYAVQLLARIIIVRVVRNIIERHSYATNSEKHKRGDTLASVFKTLAGVVIWITATLVVLRILHVDIAALMTGAGLIGIIIGFGAQNTIKDLLAGIFIISENQYRVGDIVQLSAGGKDVAGVVEDLTIRITKLRDLDGNLHVVKNGSAEVVTNLSIKYANANVDINIAYDADINLVEKVINKVGADMAKDPAWEKHIYEPIVFLRVDGFEDSSIRIKALGKVEPAKQWDISGNFLRRIKLAFEENKIEIPYPQVVVHSKTKK